MKRKRVALDVFIFSGMLASCMRIVVAAASTDTDAAGHVARSTGACRDGRPGASVTMAKYRNRMKSLYPSSLTIRLTWMLVL